MLESLKNQSESWLVDLLFIMNAGDIAGFHKLKPKWSSQADLLRNERTVLQKITLLALMEVILSFLLAMIYTFYLLIID